jgi:hypothetical protein
MEAATVAVDANDAHDIEDFHDLVGRGAEPDCVAHAHLEAGHAPRPRYRAPG